LKEGTQLERIQPKSIIYRLPVLEEDEDEAEDTLLEINDLFEDCQGPRTKLMIRVTWKNDGKRDEAFRLVYHDAEEAVTCFLKLNPLCYEMARKHSAAVRNKKTFNATKKDKPTVTVMREKEKVMSCCLDHLEIHNLKMETRGSYFTTGNKYCGVKCEKCREKITTATAMNPVYCCINECQGCTKSVCGTCVKNIIGTMDTSKTGRRSRRN